MEKGIIFKIQKYSIHDGPGIRTAVFLKGCPLDCWWCHNPEGKKLIPEPVFHKEKCIKCGRCDDICPTGARETIGQEMTLSDVVKEAEKDFPFYEQSGGGVTFTGGEPFMQFDFLYSLLSECRKRGIHTAVETSGYTSWENLYEASRQTDMFLYDLKLIDDMEHRQYTGVSNKLILENLKKLAAVHGNICVRIPFIPGVNDDEENIGKTCEFLKETNIKLIDILPYHNIGEYKYEKLCLDYRLPGLKSPDESRLSKAAEIFKRNNFIASVGGRSE